MIYYWPPSGGSGVQRWLFLTNFFSIKGLDVTVFVPNNLRIGQKDDALRQKIHHGMKYIMWEVIMNTL